MNVLSCCSGVGGLDRGLEAAGMTAVGFCELDRHARDVLARHWPDVPCHDDITTLDGKAWRGRVDLVAGGTPCTDLSVAGRGAGLAGEHSRIFWDFCRVAADSAARWVLWENVPRALSINGGEDFAAVLWGLTGFRPAVPADGWRTIGVCIGPARTAVWRLLDARWFGVAQRRRRVFVVAGARNECGLEILVEPDSVPRGARPGGTAGQEVAGTLGGGAGSRGWCPDTDRMTFVPTVVDLAQITSAENRSNPQQGDPAPALAATSQPIAFGWSNAATQGDSASIDETPTLRTKMQPAVTDRCGVRRLTPRECERLMGWPDDWTRYRPDGTEIADSHRYRFCGNGVVSNCTEWIGRRLMEASQ